MRGMQLLSANSIALARSTPPSLPLQHLERLRCFGRWRTEDNPPDSNIRQRGDRIMHMNTRSLIESVAQEWYVLCAYFATFVLLEIRKYGETIAMHRVVRCAQLHTGHGPYGEHRLSSRSHVRRGAKAGLRKN